MNATPLPVVSMMYFFLFSSPATVFAVSPARAAISTKLILGGVGTETWEAAPSPVRCAKAKQANSKPPNTSTAFEKCERLVRIDALPRILQLPQSVHLCLTVV